MADATDKKETTADALYRLQEELEDISIDVDDLRDFGGGGDDNQAELEYHLDSKGYRCDILRRIDDVAREVGEIADAIKEEGAKGADGGK
jgi:NTP pyrophosphatase (non-canonical NTP hydrolase)